MSQSEPRSQLLTSDFWIRAATQAIHTIAGAAIGILTSEGISTLHDVPWQGLATSAFIGGAVSLLGSIASVPVPGTVPASFLPAQEPKFVARFKGAHGDGSDLTG